MLNEIDHKEAQKYSQGRNKMCSWSVWACLDFIGGHCSVANSCHPDLSGNMAKYHVRFEKRLKIPSRLKIFYENVVTLISVFTFHPSLMDVEWKHFALFHNFKFLKFLCRNHDKSGARVTNFWGKRSSWFAGLIAKMGIHELSSVSCVAE